MSLRVELSCPYTDQHTILSLPIVSRDDAYARPEDHRIEYPQAYLINEQACKAAPSVSLLRTLEMVLALTSIFYSPPLSNVSSQEPRVEHVGQYVEGPISATSSNSRKQHP